MKFSAIFHVLRTIFYNRSNNEHGMSYGHMLKIAKRSKKCISAKFLNLRIFFSVYMYNYITK